MSRRYIRTDTDKLGYSLYKKINDNLLKHRMQEDKTDRL